MPTLRMIDAESVGPKTGPFSLPDEVDTHVVKDRNQALGILETELVNTAAPEWSAGILAEFEEGSNRIERPNGTHAWFIVEYSEV